MTFRSNPWASKAMDKHNIRKATEHLLGICHGIAADQVLNDSEIHFLATWLKQYPEALAEWPGKTLARRISEILQDGIVTDDERRDLLSTLNSLCGNQFSETGDASSDTIELPFDDDPHVIFDGRQFCFTGNFIYGQRGDCEEAIVKLGGIPAKSVTKKLDYLVVGSLISRDWATTSYGTKIATAMRYIDKGEGIALINEAQWHEALTHYA